ncbi:outer membrane efflux protein [Legionella lansingensis]|uniref:Outer membrane efflux protein n=2 Tax=Legionella lansingensis TaxID=45067 RepID=A0A0W0VJT8_9GAMM|nr:outer membrane efflux protein [Legionella lansingensis]SNV51043.1 outer membrane efflux protein [Legionella lansingensis]
MLMLFITLGLLNCSQDHRTVAVKTAKSFPSMAKEYKPVKNLPYFAWWTQFHDPVLDNLIHRGLRNNLDIGIALGNLEEARGLLKEIKLSWIPSLIFFGGYSTNPALGSPGGVYGVWPYYAINIAQQFQKQKQATYYLAYNQAAVEGVRLLVIGQIASAYFTLIAQQEQLRLLQQLNNDVLTLLKQTEDEVNIGLSNAIDVSNIQMEKALIAAQLKTTQHNITTSQNALRYLVNQNPGPIVTPNHFAQLDFNRFKPGSLPVTVLRNRPDLKMAAYAVKQAQAGKAIAIANFFPLLQLDQYFGEAHVPESKLAEMTDAYLTWTVAPNTWGKIATQRGIYHAQVSHFIKTVRRILRDVDNDLSANRQYRSYYQKISEAQEDYQHKLRLQKGLLKAGLISYKVWLENKIVLDNLAISTNQAKLQLAMSLVLLYQDLAGGYQC